MAPDHRVTQPAGPSGKRSATLRSGASAQMLPAGRHLDICWAPHHVEHAGISPRSIGPMPDGRRLSIHTMLQGLLVSHVGRIMVFVSHPAALASEIPV